MTKNNKENNSSQARPPIVAVLGHVDHGKTSLLDAIRNTHVAQREAGGITQKIGAYQVEVGGRKITFIDTPGHQAFSAMRGRGANVADLVILVVAGDDGVMPQTIESLEHIKAAGVPFLVAITKTDLSSADPQRIKKQLSDNGIAVEGYGGDVVCVPVSAVKGEGIKDLLEMIVLLAEMEGLKGDPQGLLEAVVIESKTDRRGPVGTVIIRSGTLRVGDWISVEKVSSRVRGMMDENGKNLTLAQAGQPVEVLGFENVPPVGAKVERENESVKTQTTLPQFGKLQIPTQAKDKLKIILRTDTLGSGEAIKKSLPENVFIAISGVGDILESDILLARTIGAWVLGFNVKASISVEKLAEMEKIKIKTYKIIYELLEDVEKEAVEKVTPAEEREVLGKAMIANEFDMAGAKIAGCRVLEGRINQADSLIVKRGEGAVGQTRISSMKHQKTDIREAQKGEEFGAIFSPALDFKVGDMLISSRPAE